MASKILFVNQPVSMEKRYAAQSKFANHTAPLTLCHLASITRKHGFRTAILDAAALGLGMGDAVSRIAGEQPRYLGLYATTVSIEEAAALAALAKEAVPGLLVIIGGIHLTTCPEETMRRYLPFDVGVIGEGDITIRDLLEALEGRVPLNKVRGIIFREGGRLVRTAERVPIADLNSLPMPAFDLLEGFPHIYMPPFFGFTVLPVATAFVSRGCPSRCLFCSSGIFGSRNLRVQSPKYIVELMRHLKERYGVRQVLFYDDNFGTFKAHVRELCERLIEKNLGLTWSCNTRVTDVNPEILALMKEAGCWQISYGIESGSQRLLDFMRKGTTLEVIRKALRWTKKAGIRTNGYFILGFPTETEEEIRQTISFAKSLDLDIFQCTLFTPFPSVAFAKDAGSYGMLANADWNNLNIFNPVFVSEGISAEKLERYKRRAWREFYLRPRVQLNLIRMLLKNPAMVGQYIRTAFEFVRFAVIPGRFPARNLS